jgi:uncharacterized protein YcbK (DUF882 family)
MQRENDIPVSEHFRLYEFECRCCNRVKLQPELLEKLEILRSIVNEPLVVVSGFRCKKHNTAVGGSPKSQHLHGRAADIKVPSNWLRTVNSSVNKEGAVEELAKAAETAGFDGIGIYYREQYKYENQFVHCDVRGYEARWTDKEM